MKQRVRKLYYAVSDLLRRISISKRFVLIFAAICGIPLIVIGVYTSSVYSRAMTAKFEAASAQTIRALNKYVSTEIEKSMKFAYQMIADQDLQQTMDQVENNTIARDLAFAQLQNTAFNYYWSESYANISILDSKGEKVYSFGFAELDDDFVQNSIRELKENDINHQWRSTYTMGHEKVVVLSKIIYSMWDSNKILGYLNLIFDADKLFDELYKDMEFGEGAQGFIIGSDLRYLSEQHDRGRHAALLEETNPDLAAQMQTQRTGSTYEDYDGQKNLIIWDYNRDGGWWIASAVPTAYLLENMHQMQHRLVGLLIILLVGGSGVILLICSTIILPINQLVKYSTDISEGRYNANIQPRGNDEITRLFEHQKEMVGVLIGLGELIRKKTVAKQKMELQLLQSQINPHFIFNTLNIFKTIAEFNDVPAISNGIEAFSNLLRQTIVRTDDMITLEEELENLKSYFTIQEYKYLSRFTVEYQAEDEVMQVKVPKLLLQPIVENSIVHGMSNSRDLEICISCRRKGEFVEICIEDNGCGFDPARIAPEEKKRHMNSIGVKNVEQRIHIIYGEESSFKLESEVNQGTKVTIDLPLETKQEE